MHLANTPIKHLSTVWLLFMPFLLIGQIKIPVNWNLFQKVAGDHWVTSLHLSPDIYLNSSLKFDTDFKTNINELSSSTLGATIFKNSPKRTFIYGMGFNYNYCLNEFQAFNSLYRLDIQSIGSTFFIGAQKPNIIRNNHPFINLGLTQRYLLSNSISVFDNTLRNFNNNTEFNKFPTWGYLEIGIRRDEFLIMNDRSRLKNLSVAVDFPFFNRSDLFSTKRDKYNPKTLNLLHSTNPQFGIRVNYQQYIDTKSSTIFDEDAKQDITKRNLFIPPLVSIEDPNHALFGRIFVDFTFSNPRDSIDVSTKDTDPQIIPKAIFNQIAIGYNIHFGNYRETIDQTKRNKNVYYDVFGNIALNKNTIHSSTYNLYKYESIGLKTGLGLRVGTNSGIFLLIGGDYQIKELTKAYTKNFSTITDNIKFPINDNVSFYGGLSYKNLIMLKIIYGNTKFSRKNPINTLDNFYYSITIGF